VTSITLFHTLWLRLL